MIAPERIWADPPSLFDGVDLWHEKQEGAELTAVEYIRKDASDMAIAAARAEGVRVAASLAAAISLLERGGKAAKKAAPSDKMFDQMLIDYRAALDAFRKAYAEAQP